ncbi:Lipase (class 2) [Williamsia sterculiae]|uniref:Lipase (Class 2) n=1 Tax=Williamsia sterculiae TaxID=1344003 RepID=A0A1N7DT21_9NOCA|nr:Lipase (class 2) [Williamsia sterculiae]
MTLAAAAVCVVANAVVYAAPAPGGDDVTCRPDAAHPRPVVLVHGDGAGVQATWPLLRDSLRRDGFCVFAPEYGRHTAAETTNLLDFAGGSDIRTSAIDVGTYLHRVRSSTGARQIDVVAHSMGALTVRQFLRFDGGWIGGDPPTSVVRTLVSVAGPNHGTTFNGNQGLRDRASRLGLPADDAIALGVGPSYTQQMVGSSLLTELNAGGDTLPGIRYVALATHDDAVVTPPASGFLAAVRGAAVQNVWVQDGCPGRVVSHSQMTTDSRSRWMIRQALDTGAVSISAGPCAADATATPTRAGR